MTTEIVLRYLHFISIFAIIGALVSEHLLLQREMTRAEIKRIAVIDAVYGIAALVLLGAGLTLWLGGISKPTGFYSNNPFFHAKFGLFLTIGLLSIYPTVFFVRNRKGEPAEKVAIPGLIFTLVRLEILIAFIIPLLAVIMARGIGLTV